MNIEQVIRDLRSEPVSKEALERTLAKTLQATKVRRPWAFRRQVILVSGIAVVASFALIPFRESDRIWAQAKQALVDAKFVHIRLESVNIQGPGDVWIHGDKVIESNNYSETRSNGKQLTNLVGQVSSTRPISHPQDPFLRGYLSFKSAVNQIKDGRAKMGRQLWNGKQYETYRFQSGGSSFGDSFGNQSSQVVDIFLTAFVDVGTKRIVRLEQHGEPNANLEKYKRTHRFTLGPDWMDSYKMDARIDYPESIDDARFDPPADAFDQTKIKEVVTSILAGKVGEQTVAGQKVKLHGILFDGRNINVIWSGSPANYGDVDRFRIKGVTLGPPRDVRCLSSGKYSQIQSSKVPFCQLGAEVVGDVPKTVTLTLPVFAPDKLQPIGTRGFRSRKVGEVTFENVPVTPTLWIIAFERQFGLLNHWW